MTEAKVLVTISRFTRLIKKTMNALALNAAIANFTSERLPSHSAPEQIINTLRRLFKQQADGLGAFRGMRCTERRSIGRDLSIVRYALLYERQTLVIKLTRFKPRNQWEVSGFSLG